MEYKHICPWCEKEFISNSSKNIFCSFKCSTNNTVKKTHLQYKEKHKKENEEIRNRKVPDNEIHDTYIYEQNGIFAKHKNDFIYHPNDIKICQQCGKKVITTRENFKYCSNKCLIESHKHYKNKICKNCGKNFLICDKDDKFIFFCSDKCENDFNEYIEEKHLLEREKTKTYCVNCLKEFYTIDNRNIVFCSGKCELEFGIKKHLKKYICKECGKEFLSHNKKDFCSKHCISSHIMKNNQQWKKVKRNGMLGRKHTLIAREKMSKTISKAIQDGKMNGKNNAINGYVKFIPHCFRSTWEFNFSLILLYLKRDYRYEAKSLKIDERKRYIPDFYDVKRNIFYEIKGKKQKDWVEKIELIKKLYPNIKIRVIDDKFYKKICLFFGTKLKLVNNFGKKLKDSYTYYDIKQLKITKNEHETIYKNNIYKQWDKKFDEKLGLIEK